MPADVLSGRLDDADDRELACRPGRFPQTGSPSTGSRGSLLKRRRAADLELTVRGGRYKLSDQSGPCPQGPVIANVTPGVWMLTNSHRPSGL